MADAGEASQLLVMSRVGPLVALSLLGSATYGILMPVLPILMTEYFARIEAHGLPIDCEATPHDPLCVEGSKRAAWMSSIFASIGSVLLIFTSPLIGKASDMLGRKAFLLIGQVLSVGEALAAVYFTQPSGSVAPYFAVSLVSSAFGTDGVSNAAIADCIRPSHRAAAFGYIMAAAIVGFSFASLASTLVSHVNSLFLVLGISFTRVFLVTFVFTETLPTELRTQEKLSVVANPFSSFAILFRSRLFKCLTALIALSSFATTGFLTIQFYFLNVVVGFSAKHLAYVIILGGFTSILSQGFLLQPLIDRFHERGVIALAFLDNFVTSLLSVFMAGLYPREWLVFASIPLGILSTLSFPAISALKSMNISEKEQGRLQGAIYGMRALSNALGSLVYGQLYKTMKTGSPVSRTIPFILTTLVYVAGAIIALLLPTSRRSTHPSSEYRDSAEPDRDLMEEPLLANHRKKSIEEGGIRYG